MSSTAKSLVMKAQDCLDTAKQNISQEGQHDMVGYNLAQACEFFLKAICEVRNVEYPRDEEGHDLDVLVGALEESNFPTISSHADIIDLTPYNDHSTPVPKNERLDLNDFLQQVEDLKVLVGKQLKLEGQLN